MGYSQSEVCGWENYRFGFNGTEKSPEIGEGHNTTFFRENDTRIACWWSLAPKPNPSISHYVMMNNNPVAYADPLGDTIIVNKNGYIKYNRGKNNKVYYKDNEGHLELLGHLGGKVDAKFIYKNLLDENINSVRSNSKFLGTRGALIFKQFVEAGGEWDFKSNEKTIYGLANNNKIVGKYGKTLFSFGHYEFEPQDIGNHHYGAVGNAINFFSDIVLKQEAGRAQLKDKNQNDPAWGRLGEKYSTAIGGFFGISRPIASITGGWGNYGDDPRDQKMITAGIDYYNKYKTPSQFLHKETEKSTLSRSMNHNAIHNYQEQRGKELRENRELLKKYYREHGN